MDDVWGEEEGKHQNEKREARKCKILIWRYINAIFFRGDPIFTHDDEGEFQLRGKMNVSTTDRLP